MEKRFRALRFIGTLYKILAWISLVGSILFSLFLVIGGVAGGLGAASGQGDNGMLGLPIAGAVGGILGGVVAMLVGLLYFLLLYAISEAIYVVLSIEENTRMTAVALSGRSSM
jgi:hypothetical protein